MVVIFRVFYVGFIVLIVFLCLLFAILQGDGIDRFAKKCLCYFYDFKHFMRLLFIIFQGDGLTNLQKILMLLLWFRQFFEIVIYCFTMRLD